MALIPYVPQEQCASDRKIPTPRSDKFSSPTNQKAGATRPSRHSTGTINGCYRERGDSSHKSAGNVIVASSSSTLALHGLMEENRVLKERLKTIEDELLGDLLHDLESERNHRKELEAKYAEEKEKLRGSDQGAREYNH
nr:protein microrchidia 7-like [Tanacetum cinerariifolium]